MSTQQVTHVTIQLFAQLWRKLFNRMKIMVELLDDMERGTVRLNHFRLQDSSTEDRCLLLKPSIRFNFFFKIGVRLF